MANPRRRIKQTTSLKDRLKAWAGAIRRQAARMAPGPEKDALLRKVSQADSAMRFEIWARSEIGRPTARSRELRPGPRISNL